MKRENVPTWDETFMEIAHVASRRSKDPSTQVGACIVSEDNRVLSLGYNGASRGFDDDEFPWGKTGDKLDTKYPFVVHAEPNAILNYRGSFRDLTGARVYVTFFPCNECAKTIAQTGIGEVVYETEHSMTDWSAQASTIIFKQAGITVRKL